MPIYLYVWWFSCDVIYMSLNDDWSQQTNGGSILFHMYVWWIHIRVIFKGLLQVSVFESSNYKKSIVNLTRWTRSEIEKQ